MRSKLIYKLLAVFLLCSLGTICIVGVLSYQSGKQLLEERSFLQLTAVKESKAQQIESYFATIRNQVLTLSENRMVVEAMVSMKAAFHDTEGLREAPEVELNRSINAYYEDEFYSRLTVRNAGQLPDLEAYLPKTAKTRHWQYLYLSDNAHKTGEKHELYHAGDASQYSRLHEKYHPNIKSFLEKFGYYDIFLIDDKTGHIVYSVFKEVDYATSLLTGPYKDTNFAEVFKEVRESDDKDRVKLTDFRAYDPSYRAPASFIASPIFDGDERVGVLVFQMPVDEINAVLTSNENWEDTGLGASGETYMVGRDKTMRSMSRFLIEDSLNYLATLHNAGYAYHTIEAIRKQNTSILIQTIATKGVEEAQKGISGTAIIDDYRGVKVLSSYRPLSIEDVEWYLLSEIDTAEAFAPISRLSRNILLSGLAVMIAVSIIAFGFSRSFIKPIDELKKAATKVALGDTNVYVRVKTKDEIGQLNESFNVMVTSIRESDEKVELQREQTKLALEKAKKSGAAAEAALDAAKEAKVQAEQSAAEAVAEKERAMASEQEAAEAMRNALRSQEEAVAALAEADRSKREAEKALLDTEVAKKEALEAQAEAEASKAQVESALENAKKAEVEALAAKEDAVSAQAEAEASKAQVESLLENAQRAESEALTAKEDAVAAQAEAEASRAQVESLLENAQRAKTEALTAKEDAVAAQAEAEASKAQVESLLSNAKTAEFEPLTAKEDAVAAQRQAEQAMRDIAEAQAKASNDQQELQAGVELMLEQIQRFAAGDLTVALPAHENYEINRLYAGFNQAVGSVKSLIERVEAAVSETQAAVHVIGSSTSAILNDARQQARQAAGIASSASEMTRTIEMNAETATNAANLSTASGEAARTGGLIIRDAVDTIKEISGNLNESVALFERLRHSGHKIGETTSFIDSIAAQTKLLALNARIEAEHAAEKGAGFAVVAKEVRVLADQTTVSTGGIADMVESVQRDTRAAISFMGNCRQIADKGVSLADEALHAIQEIDSKLRDAVTMANRIAQAAIDQTNTSNEITQSISEISSLTQKSQEQVNEIVASVDRLGEHTAQLSSMVGAFKTG